MDWLFMIVQVVTVFKLYTSGDYAFWILSKRTWIGNTIEWSLCNGANLNTGYEYPTNALLNLYIHPSNYTSALMAYANFPMDFGDVIKVYSNRHTDVAFVVRDITRILQEKRNDFLC